jgi:hypothetical protein
MKANQAKDGGGPETLQAAGIKGTFSLWAVCAWRGYWLQAHNEGSQAKETMAADGLAKVASSETMKKADTWWRVYLNVAKNEAAGDPSAPSNFEGFYQGNCLSQPQPWAGK